jgi:glycosyltransferase involved in cell wall biosynthesis
VTSADLIHLHWVSQFQSPVTIAALAELKKPLVWTLHDLRAFTGGCHFTAGCERWKEQCFPCPQLRDDPCSLPKRNLADQELLWCGNQFTIVTPSAWLARLAAQSRTFRDCRIEVIPNGIDPRAFFPSSRQQARRELGLPQEGTYVVFGADSGAERRKGADELVAAIEALLCRPSVPPCLRFLCFGKPAQRLEGLGERLIPLGYLRDNAKLRAAYTAADAFVLPSLDDNLPTTMLESLACGTPVVAFASGGIPEVVRDGVTGRLAPSGDVPALTSALADVLGRREALDALGKAGAELIHREFTVEVQTRRIRTLYETCRPPARTSPVNRQSSIGPKVRPVFPRLLWHATTLRLLGKH